MNLRTALTGGKALLCLLIPVPIILCCYGCKPADHVKRRFSASRAGALDAYMSQVKATLPIPGLAIVVISNDSVYYNATGIANAQNDPLTGTLPMSAGSISEPMLATAVMKLVESGKLKLDDPVSKYLPYFKMAGKVNNKVLIRHLLAHSSGIQHYNVMWDTPNNTAGALEVTTRSIAEQQPKFPVPGSRIVRSPYNYDILADLISKATGQPFEDYVKDAVFKPLGMDASSFSKPAITAMPFSINNWLSYTTKQDSLYPYNRENGGSNGLHTTPGDMASWMYMLLNKGKVAQNAFVKTDVFEEFFTPQYKTGNNASVGFGWEINGKEDEAQYTKTSTITDFSSQVTLIPGKNIGVAVFSNIAGEFNTAEITRQLILWLNGNQLQQPKTPVGMAMGKKLDETGSLDSAFKVYTRLKDDSLARYDVSEAALNHFGNNLIRHFRDYEKATEVFKFCTVQYPQSALGYLNLASAYLLNKKYTYAMDALARSKPFQQSNDDKNYAKDLQHSIDEKTKDQDPG